MNKPKFETPDMTQKNKDKISQLFPNCITESKDENGKQKKVVNFEMQITLGMILFIQILLLWTMMNITKEQGTLMKMEM